MREEKKGTLENLPGVFSSPFPRNHQVKSVTEYVKSPSPGPEEIVSGGMKQNEIDKKMTKIVDKFKDLFVGLGRAKGVDPIHIYTGFPVHFLG